MRNLHVNAGFLKAATAVSSRRVIHPGRKCFLPWLGCMCAALAGLFLFISGQALAANWDTNAAVADIKKAFQESRRRYLSNTNDPEAAWRFARACYDLSDLATSNPEKADFASQGISAAQSAIQKDSNSAPAHYYLAMDIGQLADTRRNLSALRMVREMEREFLTARALDEHFDHAGPDRNLGLLYSQAPVIASIGSRSKARQHLKMAIQLAGDFPENHLNLIEAYLKWGDKAQALQQLTELERLWPEAQKKFTGEEWALSWVDWQKRLTAAEKKLENAMKTTGTPHSAR